MTVTFVDAGHGYALLLKDNHEVEMLAGGDGLPVGIMPDSVYSVMKAKLPASGRALVVSDGIIEQSEGEAAPGSARRQFEVYGIKTSLGATGPAEDPISRLFESVFKWAGTESLSDDATAVMVKWQRQKSTRQTQYIDPLAQCTKSNYENTARGNSFELLALRPKIVIYGQGS